MKLLAVLALAFGFIAAPMMTAAGASAEPDCDGVDCAPAQPLVPVCNAADCVPYVNHGAAVGVKCFTQTRWVYGIDSSGNTLVCTGKSEWAKSAPLVGVRNFGQFCGDDKGTAQSPDGQPLACKHQAWLGNYDPIFYP
jgi:hypothetical protein